MSVPASAAPVHARHWLGIVNPYSGAMRSARFRQRWLPLIERAVSTLKLTAACGDATVLAREARRFDGIAVAGGDGTVYEVLGGIDRDRQRLAIVPTGRGNNLARELGISDVAAAVQLLAAGVPQPIDLIGVHIWLTQGRTLHRIAASTLALGYVVGIVRRADEFLSFGPLCYACASPFVRPNPEPVAVAYDGEAVTERVLTGMVINNTRFLANAMVFPEANLTDGRLEVIELTAGWAWQNLHNLSILAGRPVARGSRERQVTDADVRIAKPAHLLVDGEMIADVVRFTARCLPGGVTCQRAAPT